MLKYSGKYEFVYIVFNRIRPITYSGGTIYHFEETKQD